MMNMKHIAFVTPPSIYHGCSTGKILWEEKFTVEEKSNFGEFLNVNLRNCGRRDVRKHIEIKVSEKYVTLDISLKFYSLDKMKITSSELKYNLGRSVKRLITSMGINVKAGAKK